MGISWFVLILNGIAKMTNQFILILKGIIEMTNLERKSSL